MSMARGNSSVASILYTAVGVAAAAGIAWLAFREVRRRRAHGEDAMLEVRRASRKAGRAAKDAAAQVGKAVKRGFRDASEAVKEASLGGEAPPDAANYP
jgi:Flp pilus assembly protein TadB